MRERHTLLDRDGSGQRRHTGHAHLNQHLAAKNSASRKCSWLLFPGLRQRYLRPPLAKSSFQPAERKSKLSASAEQRGLGGFPSSKNNLAKWCSPCADTLMPYCDQIHPYKEITALLTDPTVSDQVSARTEGRPICVFARRRL